MVFQFNNNTVVLHKSTESVDIECFKGMHIEYANINELHATLGTITFKVVDYYYESSDDTQNEILKSIKADRMILSICDISDLNKLCGLLENVKNISVYTGPINEFIEYPEKVDTVICYYDGDSYYSGYSFQLTVPTVVFDITDVDDEDPTLDFNITMNDKLKKIIVICRKPNQLKFAQKIRSLFGENIEVSIASEY